MNKGIDTLSARTLDFSRHGRLNGIGEHIARSVVPFRDVAERRMTTCPDKWVYGDFAPNPSSHDLVGLKARWILEHLPVTDAPLVLDYGAGEGKYLHLVRTVKPRARLVGVDIREARTAVDFEFHRVTPNAPLPLADDAFDLVISCDVLEHVESIEHSLGEIHRVLRSGGSFIGFVPAEGGIGAHALFRFLDQNIYRDTKDHGHAYTRRELLKSLSCHFRIEQLAYSYHLLGATLDAAFFASFKIPRFGPKMENFWRGQENDVYRTHEPNTKPSMANRLVLLANRVAYYESRLLKNVSLGAKGLHFHVVKR
jgi:SAM-dependent methyltransferase